MIEGGHEIDLPAAELALEDADARPWVVWLVFRRHTPEIVPFIAHRLGPLHDLEMEQIGSHDTSAFPKRSTKEIGSSPAEKYHYGGSESSVLVLGEENGPALAGTQNRH